MYPWVQGAEASPGTQELSPQEMGAKIAAAMLARIFGGKGPPSSKQNPVKLSKAPTAATPAFSQNPRLPLTHQDDTAAEGEANLPGRQRLRRTPANAAVPEVDGLPLKLTEQDPPHGSVSLAGATPQLNTKAQIDTVQTSSQPGHHAGQMVPSYPAGPLKGAPDCTASRVDQHDRQLLGKGAADNRPGSPLQPSEDIRQRQAHLMTSDQVAATGKGGGTVPGYLPLAATSSRPADTGALDEAAQDIRQQMARAEGMEVALTRVLSWLQSHVEHASPDGEPLNLAAAHALGVSEQNGDTADGGTAQNGAATHSAGDQCSARKLAGRLSSCAQHQRIEHGHSTQAPVTASDSSGQPEIAPAAAFSLPLHPQPSTRRHEGNSGQPSAQQRNAAEEQQHAQILAEPVHPAALQSDADPTPFCGDQHAGQSEPNCTADDHSTPETLAGGSRQLDCGREAAGTTCRDVQTISGPPFIKMASHDAEPGLTGNQLENANMQDADASGQPQNSTECSPRSEASPNNEACTTGDRLTGAMSKPAEAGGRRRYEPDEVTRRHIAALQVMATLSHHSFQLNYFCCEVRKQMMVNLRLEHLTLA